MINFIIEYFYPEIGGLERSTERLAEEMTNKGYKVNVITKNLDGTSKYEKYNGFEIYRFNNDYILEASKTGIFRDASINCVFGVGHNKEYNIWQSIFDAEKPTFIKIGTSGDIINKGIPRDYFNGFDAILCQNDSLIEETNKLEIKNLKGLKIKNGLNISEWQKSLKTKKYCRDKYQISKDDFVIVAIGRFVIRKNFPLIIESVNKMCIDNNIKDNVTLILHGSDFGQHDGEELKIKEVAENSGLKVVFVPPNEAVTDSLSAADVFVTMGTREGAPNIIIEAMAAGLPIVASNISGHRVYVTNNGFLVDFTKEDLSNSLYKLYSNKELVKQLSKNSFNNVLEFDISKTADIYLKIFKEWGLK